jgi:ubiquinone/menaquinone biosynthesis C-methylase UbiE
VLNWSRALNFWSESVQKYVKAEQPRGLENGAWHGGMSLYFAAKHNYKMVCSDYGAPVEAAHEKHREYGIESKIEYADVNALQIPFPDNTFDVVVFKSVLGALGYTPDGPSIERQQQGVNEFHRVLKPGGVLLFAENLKASAIHQLARKAFVPWGAKWRYPTVPEMQGFLQPFSQVDYKTFGFLGVLAKVEFLRKLVYPVEVALNPILPDSTKYIMYGAAVK